MAGWRSKNPSKCPFCRKVYKQKERVNYKLRQAIEEIRIKCSFCSIEFNYGDTKAHSESCKGLNYTCPNEGCGQS